MLSRHITVLSKDPKLTSRVFPSLDSFRERAIAVVDMPTPPLPSTMYTWGFSAGLEGFNC
ncbi:MAG: hypothetical protein OWQ48_00490 [Desulfurococcus sp.]|nr:hypothetical protein [Desulfurococcus sp.]